MRGAPARADRVCGHRGGAGRRRLPARRTCVWSTRRSATRPAGSARALRRGARRPRRAPERRRHGTALGRLPPTTSVGRLLLTPGRGRGRQRPQGGGAAVHCGRTVGRLADGGAADRRGRRGRRRQCEEPDVHAAGWRRRERQVVRPCRAPRPRYHVDEQTKTRSRPDRPDVEAAAGRASRHRRAPSSTRRTTFARDRACGRSARRSRRLRAQPRQCGGGGWPRRLFRSMFRRSLRRRRGRRSAARPAPTWTNRAGRNERPVDGGPRAGTAAWPARYLERGARPERGGAGLHAAPRRDTAQRPAIGGGPPREARRLERTDHERHAAAAVRRAAVRVARHVRRVDAVSAGRRATPSSRSCAPCWRTAPTGSVVMPNGTTALMLAAGVEWEDTGVGGFADRRARFLPAGSSPWGAARLDPDAAGGRARAVARRRRERAQQRWQHGAARCREGLRRGHRAARLARRRPQPEEPPFPDAAVNRRIARETCPPRRPCFASSARASKKFAPPTTSGVIAGARHVT